MTKTTRVHETREEYMVKIIKANNKNNRCSIEKGNDHYIATVSLKEQIDRLATWSDVNLRMRVVWVVVETVSRSVGNWVFPILPNTILYNGMEFN